MKTGKRIVRNSIFGVASQAIGGGLFFFVAILMARDLGPERFGPFSFVFAVVTVFHMIADFGLTNILVRELARQKEQVDHVLGAVIPLVTILALISYALICGTAQFLSLAPDEKQAMYIMGATVLVTFHAATYGSVCRAFEEMGYNAIGLIIQRFVLLILVIIALYLEAGLPGFALCYLGERVIQWVFFFLLVRKKYSRYVWRIDTEYWHKLLREGLPIGAGMVLRRLSWHVDIFILTALSTASSVGLFGAAYRIVQMINVIPFTLSLPVFPALSRRATNSPQEAFILYLRIQKIFILIGLPIGIWLLFLGTQLVVLLFGNDYTQAGSALQIMGLVVVLLFMNSLYVYLFSSLGRQGYFMICVALGVAVNIVLDVILIPNYDILGAAAATLCSEFAILLSGIYFLSRLGLVTKFGGTFVKPLIAAALAGSVLLWPLYDPSMLSLVMGTLSFSGVFLLVAHWLKVLSRHEMDALVSALPWEKGPRLPIQNRKSGR